MASQDSERAETPRLLLLLPPLPQADDADVITSIYGITIRDTLKEVLQSFKSFVLEIAVAYPQSTKSRESLGQYAEIQRYVSRAYGLVCAIAAQHNFDIDGRDGVDVRILLVAWDAQGTGTYSAPGDTSSIITSIDHLALSPRQWRYVFAIEDDTGLAMVKAFVKAEDRKSEDSPAAEPSQAPSAGITQPTPCVAVGGTFDHLHIGHKLLLTMTVFAAEDQRPGSAKRTAIIGITGDELLKNKKYADHLESWDQRQQGVVEFVSALIDFGKQPPTTQEVNEAGPNGHAVNTTFANGLTLRCVEISDAFGPTIAERDIQSLVISAETRSGGKAVNDKRTEQGWEPLTVLEVDVLQASESVREATGGEDFADKISSTQIRKKLSEKKGGPHM
ncbi:hypothetical protein ANO11243_064800 [Dothideomycetidae sp. 11243]|nr:hypothetical protein ANO11243_064800 [fungal sp. No.11243]